MKTSRLILTGIAVMLCLSANAKSHKLNLDALELERSCGNCHDVSSPGGLNGDDWLARMKAMGPLEDLSNKQRSEVVGFLNHHGWEVNQILSRTKERYLFEEKCGLCHAVERAFIKQTTEEDFRAMVVRMRERAPQWISEDDVDTIVNYVASGARGVSRPEHNEITGGPAEVFRGRCAGCHPLERTYLYLETTLDPAWPLLVKRMQLKAPEWISDEEAEQVVEYLVSLKPLLR
ncbi:MAG: hypothetical protein OER80_14600 [Gammaproteobacteria bacterium]|nr:hypothetical protein [Gammaproteobacteria bacterium]MDH3767385.1 hypothetical protein [Gammaproteobacteria bacterium]